MNHNSAHTFAPSQASSIFSSMLNLLYFSAPICFTNLIGILANFISMIWIAKLGEKYLAASALATITYTTILLIFSSILYSISILISHQRHNTHDNFKRIRLFFQSGCWLALFLGIASIGLLWNAEQLLHFFHQDNELIAITSLYFKFSAISILPLLLTIAISQFFIGVGTPRFTLVSGLIRLPFIIFLSYALILGRFGFPSFGLAGIMIATCIIQSIYCLGLIIFLAGNSRFKKYQLFINFRKIHYKTIITLFKLGYPIGIQFGVEILAIALLTYLMGHYGATPLAASQIVSQYTLLIIMMIQGLSQGLSSLTSKAYATRDRKQIQHFQWASVVIMLILFLSTFIFYTNPKILLSLFLSHSEELNENFIFYLKYFFIISAFTIFFDGLKMLYSSCLRGLQQTKYPMYVGMISLWGISLPLAYWLCFHQQQGPIALNAGFIGGIIFSVVVLKKKLNQETSRI